MITNKSGGKALYYYTEAAKRKGEIDSIKSGSKRLTRTQRRKLERKLKKKGVKLNG